MSTASIQEDLKLLKDVTAKLKKINSEAKVLRAHKKEIEGKVMDYLKQIDKPGLKYENLIIVNKEKTLCKPLKKREKMEALASHLKDLGIKDPKGETKKIFEEVMKGEPEEVHKLQVKQFEISL